MSDEIIEKIAKALSDKNRLQILDEIRRKGTMTCNEAGGCTALAQPTVSHHIKQLIECGLVKSEKDGRSVLLSLDRKKFDEFSKYVKQLAS
jgi:ArsR family transcriptional regulator